MEYVVDFFIVEGCLAVGCLVAGLCWRGRCPRWLLLLATVAPLAWVAWFVLLSGGGDPLWVDPVGLGMSMLCAGSLALLVWLAVTWRERRHRGLNLVALAVPALTLTPLAALSAFFFH